MKTYQKIIIGIALFLMFVPAHLPLIGGFNQIGQATVGIFLGTLLLLLTVDYVWPVFLSLAAFSINNLYSVTECIRLCLGNNIFWFMMLNAMVFVAMERSGLFRRIAVKIAGAPVARRSPWVFLFMFLFANIITGSIMNTTAVCLLFYALCEEVMQQLGYVKGDRETAVMMLLVCVASNISHAVTPFGHSITVMSMSYFEELSSMNVFGYCVVGYIVGAFGVLCMVLAAKFLMHFDAHIFSGYDIKQNAKTETPLSFGEKVSLGVLIFLIVFWVSPTLLSGIAPELSSYISGKLGIVFPLLVAIPFLSILHDHEGNSLMNIKESIRTAPWPAGVTIAISMFFGTALQNEEAGIIPVLSGAIAPVVSKLSPIVVVAVITLIIMLMSNFTSCTISVMLGCIVALTLIEGGAVTGINYNAFIVACTFAAQAAFATAPASGPAAILAGQGWIKPAHQLRTGLCFGFMWWLVAMVAYMVMSLFG